MQNCAKVTRGMRTTTTKSARRSRPWVAFLATALMAAPIAGAQMQHGGHGGTSVSSGELEWGMAWARFFPKETTFRYECMLHENHTGLVRVAGSPTSGEVKDIAIENGSFQPRVLEIRPGTTVRWTNLDDEPHTVSQPSGSQGTLFGLPWWQVGIAVVAVAGGALLVFLKPKGESRQ